MSAYSSITYLPSNISRGTPSSSSPSVTTGMNAARKITPVSVAIIHFFVSAMLRSMNSTTLMPITRISSGAMACQSIAGAVQSACAKKDVTAAIIAGCRRRSS